MRPEGANVKTKNGLLFLNHAYQPTESVRMLTEDYERQPSNIEGLEDVRVFWHNGTLHCTASSKNVTSDGRIVIAHGQYDPYSARIHSLRVLEPPRPSSCEKNWIYVPDRYLPSTEAKGRMNFLYGWNPMEIGSVHPETRQLVIHTTYPTPAVFNRFRGSSPLCEYEGKLYAVAHFVKYSQPRVYYHSMVEFDRDTMRPLQYTAPFCFRQTKIEYCLGLDIKDGVATFVFSENDTDPGMIQVPIQSLRWLNV